MAIPPFPSHEVAKLVLGYLAEEHLMTAYDEFLEASPYLDAFSNEYGRVFMTSLKNILAEYMAVKIYVETCKPISLRRKLMQCTNLLEVVKLLIALVDVQKANYQDKPKMYKQNVISKANSCGICSSSDLVSCSCNAAHSNAKSQESCDAEAISESSVEATSLSDLPGNAVIKEDSPKKVSSAIKNVQMCELSSNDANMNQRLGNEPINNIERNLNNVTSSTPENNIDVRSLPQPASLPTKPDASRKNIEEFDTILNMVTKQSVNSKVLPSTRVLNTGTFQEFADGVEGKIKDREYPIPTPEPVSTRYEKNANLNINIEGLTKEMNPVPSSGVTLVNKECNTYSTDERNPEQKIKILSDIKVNDTYSKMPPILKSTSTPLVQMQTLYINGTLAYKNNLQTGTNYSYTKDEIMAMPTFILVPSSGPSKNPQIVLPKTTSTINKQKLDTATTKGTTPRILRPLTVDVKTCSSVVDKDTKGLSLEPIENINEIGLVKTVGVTTGSLPKETTVTSPHKTSTPTILPPTKKASSTPRRTSHIRVLDFTTPRRILNENSTDKNTNDPTDPTYTHISYTPHPNMSQFPHSNVSSKTLLDQVKERNERTNDENAYNNRIHNSKSQADMPLEKKIKPKKKANWDADLRAHLGQNDYGKHFDEEAIETSRKIHNITKGNKTDKNNILQSNDMNKSIKKSKFTNSSKKRKEKSTNLSKRNKNISKEITDEANLVVSVKQTVNVISGGANSGTPAQENNNSQSQVDNDIQQSDTPEAERQALQNVIGAKLNISELLETPYKQALYDIQMETPRCLGPDLPDEPMSDIKIMNIPTPRFFDTPKLTQATPSSYSSRQTDYSSGGSYYKPDDLDYIPIAEVLECAITVAEDSNEKPVDKENNLEEIHEKPRRPVRKCTKNVSYRKNSGLSNKIKDVKNNTDSLSSDVNSQFILDKKANKKVLPKATPSRKLKSEVPSKREASIKYMKVSPSKMETQRNMKCTPRKTPMKESTGKRNKKLSDGSKHLLSNEAQYKKKTIKEKTASATSETVPVPTKSRRKSATPRKLHCTKSFNSNSGEHSLSDISKNKEYVVKDSKVLCPQDSDSEQPPLRWSDDGSQDGKSKDTQELSYPQNEEDDIDNIKKYIENCSKIVDNKDRHDNLHFDSKRIFDAETAKIIERDLLDTPPRVAQSHLIDVTNIEVDIVESTVNCQSNTSKSDSNCDSKNQCDDMEEEGDVELSVSECNEDSKNYFSYVYDESKFIENNNIIKLKDKYCIELCMEDDITIRLNATALSTVFEQDPGDSIIDENYFKETATAVSSISNIEKLYTPMITARNQCIEIFDSTLTSLDTPLKNDNHKGTECETTLTEIVLEIDNIQCKEKVDTKKRKRSQSFVSESLNNTKKLKSETQDLLKSANIQDIDIETVLSKLHGP